MTWVKLIQLYELFSIIRLNSHSIKSLKSIIQTKKVDLKRLRKKVIRINYNLLHTLPSPSCSCFDLLFYCSVLKNHDKPFALKEKMPFCLCEGTRRKSFWGKFLLPWLPQIPFLRIALSVFIWVNWLRGFIWFRE